jgi:hypothetical protein
MKHNEDIGEKSKPVLEKEALQNRESFLKMDFHSALHQKRDIHLSLCPEPFLPDYQDYSTRESHRQSIFYGTFATMPEP